MSRDELKSLFNEEAVEHFVFYPYGIKNKKDHPMKLKPSDYALHRFNSLILDKTTILTNETFDITAREILLTQKKILVLYLTSKEETDLSYKLLATNEELRKDIVFGTYIDPPENLLNSFGLKPKDLPRVAGLLPSVAGDDRLQWPAFVYPSRSFSYMEFAEFFKSLILQAQNKTGEPKIKKGKLNVVQLNSTKDLQEYCIDRTSICLIALLQAGYGEENEKELKEQLKILRKVREKKANSPMEMMWVNISCHKEMLKSLELEEMAIPTLALYAPKKKIVGNMIGKFDMETVQDYVEGIFIGKTIGLRKFEEELQINNIDCSQITNQEGEALTEEERKALEEIIAEEERKRKELKKELKKKKDDL